jgi:CheY-like chemotaxis protein
MTTHPYAAQFVLAWKDIQDFLCAAKPSMARMQSLKQRHSNPDFVLLDLSMPGINGVDTASALKRLIPRVHIVAFTLYAELLGKGLPSALGIDALIDKLAGIKEARGVHPTLDGSGQPNLRPLTPIWAFLESTNYP